MDIWIYLFISKQILTATCPFTIKTFGQMLGVVTMVATLVFVVLTFFFAQQWWYGLISCVIYIFVPMFVPKVNAYSTNKAFITYSNIGSLVAPILVVLMYISLFVGTK